MNSETLIFALLTIISEIQAMPQAVVVTEKYMKLSEKQEIFLIVFAIVFVIFIIVYIFVIRTFFASEPDSDLQ